MTKLTTTANFNFKSREYQHLFDRGSASAFQHPDWLTAFYDILLKDRPVEPLIVVGRSESTGELEIVIPLARQTVGGAILVEYAFAGVTDYACPVAMPDFAAGISFSEQLLAVLGQHDLLRIEPVRNSDTPLWRQLLGRQPEELVYGNHPVCLGAPFKAWRDRNLGLPRARQLDRKLRRLSEVGRVDFRLLSAERAAGALASARKFREGRFKNDPLQTENGFRFYMDIATAGARSGFARTYELTCRDERVAICFGLVDGDQFRYLLLACDYEAYARYSPGLLVLDLAIADWASAGGQVFDFTIGDEPFKSDFGGARSPMFRFCRANTERGKSHT